MHLNTIELTALTERDFAIVGLRQANDQAECKRAIIKESSTFSILDLKMPLIPQKICSNDVKRKICNRLIKIYYFQVKRPAKYGG